MSAHPTRIVSRFAIGLLSLLALLSLAIAIAPEPQPRPLLPANGIVVDSGFIRNDPPRDYEARKGILRSPELATWRSWNPTDGSVPGDAHSLPFPTPRFMAVPYQGFAGDADIQLDLECIASRARLSIANARTNTQWAEVLVHPPDGWCVGDSRLIAHSGSRQHYLAFGTPFEVSLLAWLKTRFPGLLVIYLVVFAAVAGLCVVSAAWLRRLWPSGDEMVLGMIGLGLLGYAMFFAFYLLRGAGLLACVLALIASGVGLYKLWNSRDRLHPAASVAVAWRLPTLAWLLVSLSYALLLFSVDNGAGPWLANARFVPVRWSTDNQLPSLVGEYLARLNLADLDLNPWLISDRTPLSYGLHAWLRAPTLLLTRGNDGPHIAPFVHTLIGIVLNTAWVPVLVHMLRRIGLTVRITALALSVTTLLPFCIFNSVYIWPKLLGASFGLLAIWLLLIERTKPETETEQRSRWIQAALLSAMALLSHGGTVFGILAMLALAFTYSPRPRLSTLLASGLAGVSLLVPWMLWQRVVQPNGNALLKSVFGGTYGFDERTVGVLETIQRSYAQITVGDWLGMKLDALRTLLWAPTQTTCGMGEMVAGAHGVDAWRIGDFLSLAPSIKFLWLGLAVLAWPALRHGRSVRPASLLLAVGLLGVAIDTLGAWDCQIIHTQSYQAVLAIIVGLLLLLLQSGPRRFGLSVVMLSMIYGAIVWVYDPLVDALRLDPFALAGYCLLWALAAYWVGSLPSSGQPSEIRS